MFESIPSTNNGKICNGYESSDLQLSELAHICHQTHQELLKIAGVTGVIYPNTNNRVITVIIDSQANWSSTCIAVGDILKDAAHGFREELSGLRH